MYLYLICFKVLKNFSILIIYMSFQEKYLKYKNKYLALKKQIGGYINDEQYLNLYNNRRRGELNGYKYISVGEYLTYPDNIKDPVFHIFYCADEIELRLKSLCYYNNTVKSQVVDDWIIGAWTEAFTYETGNPVLKQNYAGDKKFQDTFSIAHYYNNINLIRNNYIRLYNKIINDPMNKLNFNIKLFRWSTENNNIYNHTRGSVGQFKTITGASPLKSITDEFYDKEKNCCLYVINWQAGFPIVPLVFGGRAEVILPPFNFRVLRVEEHTETTPTIIHIYPRSILDVTWSVDTIVNANIQLPLVARNSNITVSIDLIQKSILDIYEFLYEYYDINIAKEFYKNIFTNYLSQSICYETLGIPNTKLSKFIDKLYDIQKEIQVAIKTNNIYTHLDKLLKIITQFSLNK